MVQQLLDLVFGNVVMLLPVKDRYQHVNVVEQLGQLHRAADRQIHVRRFAPLRKAVVKLGASGRNRVPQRLEQFFGKLGVAVVLQRGKTGRQAQRRVRKLLALITTAVHGRSEYPRNCRAHERSGSIGPVIDVVKQSALPAAHLSPRKVKGVDVKQQRRRGAFVADLRIKDVSLSVRKRKLLRPLWVFVQQVAQVLRVVSFVRNGQ